MVIETGACDIIDFNYAGRNPDVGHGRLLSTTPVFDVRSNQQNTSTLPVGVHMASKVQRCNAFA
jgi:hypothetical protein